MDALLLGVVLVVMVPARCLSLKPDVVLGAGQRGGAERFFKSNMFIQLVRPGLGTPDAVTCSAATATTTTTAWVIRWLNSK